MEPISTSLFIAFQIGVSLFNQYHNRKTTEAIKAEQHKAKKAELLNNQRRDMERFQRSCQLQEQIETESHLYKLRSLQQDFLNSFEQMIHKDNLETNYRLNISPYIIERSVIPMFVEDLKNARHEVFCILTGSNDKNFNRDVLPYLDDAICDALSQCWNESSNHTICYYQNVWDCKATPFSNEDIVNLNTLISTPTITITPFLLKEKKGYLLMFKVNVWGVGKLSVSSFDIMTEVKFDTLPQKYNLTDINEIVEEVVPYAICSIGQITDVFYWSNFYQPPMLPYLIGNNLIIVPPNLKTQYILDYSILYNKLVIGMDSEEIEASEPQLVAKDVVEINMYNHPERSIAFLRNFMMLSKGTSISCDAIRNSMIYFYKSKTDHHAETLDDIDASLICIEDFAFVSEYIELAKQCKASKLVRELTDILKRKIMSWK